MSNSTAIIDLTFNLISGITDIIGIVVCLILLSAIIYRFIRIKYHRGRMELDVSLVLSINILCVILIKSTLQITHVTVPTLRKDFHSITVGEETFLHRFRAYLLYSMNGVLFWSYALLAFFRFVRVIYFTKLWLRRLPLYLYILIPSQFLGMFTSMLPLLFIFNSLYLIPNEVYCAIKFTEIYPTLYSSIINFFIPYSMMCFFYVRIARKMRETSAIRQEHELHRRDFIVIRRMFFNIVILSMLATPYTVIYIICLVQKQAGSIFYRVQWVSSSTCSCLFSLTLPLISTQLHDFVRPNRLGPINLQS